MPKKRGRKTLPVQLQKRHIERELRKRGIEPDLVDLDALIDPTLTYQENLTNILAEIQARRKEMTEDEAEAQRKEFLHNTAEEIEAISEENVGKWANNPEKYDLEGVDYPIEGVIARYGELELIGEHGVIAIMGNRGAGKTYLMTHVKTYTDKMVWIDPTGVIKPEGAIRIRIDVLPDEETFKRVIEKALKHKKRIVFDVSDLRREEMVMAVDWIAETMMNYARRTGTTITVALDEIGEYAEQEKSYYSSELERMVRVGRNYGILWVIIATQRPQKANKHILALSDYYIAMRMLHNRDLEAIKELMGAEKDTWKAIRREIINQRTGEYLLYSGRAYVWVRGGKK